MLVYFACSPSKIHMNLLYQENVENILLSYAFIKSARRVIELLGDYPLKNLIVDSGAFSVWANGGLIDIDSYANFCSELQSLLPSRTNLTVVNLDVLPGVWGYVPSKEQIAESAERGWQNMLYLESKGLKVIHVFHQHEDFSILDRLTAHSDYIGISPANDVSMVAKLQWMRKVFSRIGSKVKTHGFAVTSHKQLFMFPYYSVDSSSWISPAKFGRIPIITDDYQIKSCNYKNPNDVEQFWPYLKELGFEKISSQRWEDRTRLAIRSYKKLNDVATQLWESRGVKW